MTRSELFIGNCYAVAPGRATARFHRITAVVIKGKPRFADFGLMPFNWGAHSTRWLTAFADAYPFLEKICLKRMSVTDDDLGLIANSFPSLKELTLVCCEGFGTNGLALLASKSRYFGNLLTLSLIWIVGCLFLVLIYRVGGRSENGKWVALNSLLSVFVQTIESVGSI